MDSILELKWELGGPRNYLDGKPLHAGDLLEVLEPNGSWVLARYEYYWNRRTQEFESHFLVDGDDISGRWVDSRKLTSLRWPK